MDDLTIDQIELVLQTDVLVAQAVNAETGEGKRLTYNPFDFLYKLTVTGDDGFFLTESAGKFINPYQAIEKYNAIKV